MEFRLSTEWNSLLQHFSNSRKDTYFTEEYVKLYETENDTAVCFICEESENLLLFPFLRREFEFDGQLYYDFETAYGYGGPIANTSDPDFINDALQQFYDYCVAHSYISGFVRFHPLLENWIGYEVIGRVLLDRHTVAIDLHRSQDEVWMTELSSKNRNTIKKAIGQGLRFEADYEFKYLDNFIDLYSRTMDKLGADEFYIFDRSYYDNWIKQIPGSFLGLVFSGDKIISAAIFFYSHDYAHYHLSGSDRNYLSMSPNNFMLWEAAKELKYKNVTKFHLGGGSNSDENNSLLDFKRRFSKSRYEFMIGKTIFNQDIYNALCGEWEIRFPEKAVVLRNHLLKYKY